ncbi:bifunctional adenosylcobinamide kinase/adenosylcobinamide-phosphate guanylyltransferase [Cytobacillus sp. FJAT-54145]|uniref:Bifunctional adenosylcobinamide kinase/adenosylcobinamide-phosphate guanylyltransferase n=1 Tax=Cytobacillus spartinae TaxID=3299023 RepID=A0ABW6KFE2_9BACI
MHFVTGGAFNGKRDWVTKQYPEAHWVSAYKGETFVDLSNLEHFECVVFEGIEQWIKNDATGLNRRTALDKWREIIEQWIDWEHKKQNRQVIIIGTDISKGIVPISKEDRLWRDITGWVYQVLALNSSRVDAIWYGINTTIKGDLK